MRFFAWILFVAAVGSSAAVDPTESRLGGLAAAVRSAITAAIARGSRVSRRSCPVSTPAS